MTALDAYLNAVGAGLDIIAAVQGLSDRELIARGASDIAARDLLRLCDTYFGRCGFAAKQRAARQTRHSLDVLLLIEKYALRLPTPPIPTVAPTSPAHAPGLAGLVAAGRWGHHH